MSFQFWTQFRLRTTLRYPLLDLAPSPRARQLLGLGGLLFVGLLLALIFPRPALSQVDPFVVEGPLAPAELAAFDTLALREGSLALDGNRLIAGAFGADGNGVDSGAAFVFERDVVSNAWVETAHLLPNVTPCTSALGFAVANRFGYAVDIDGDRAVVGAPGEDCLGAEKDGAVYIYLRSAGGSWVLEQKISSPVALASVGFGSAVALDGLTLVVGAEFLTSDQNPPQNSTGGAFVFDRGPGGWSLTRRLYPSDGPIDQHGFGSMAVAVAGDRVAVGAPGDNTHGGRAGAIYLYQRNLGGVGTWGQSHKLTPTTKAVGDIGRAQDELGWVVALNEDGTTLVGGAPGIDAAAADQSGGIYIFERDLGGAEAWGLADLVTSATPVVGEAFGTDVAASGALVLVGARDDHALAAPGAAYVVAKTGGWAVAQKLAPGAPSAYGRYGASVALGGGPAVVGSPGDDSVDAEAGILFTYRQEAADTDFDGVVDGSDNCPDVFNPDQTDSDGNGVGDACEPPPPADGDGDGVPDDIDNCPATPNADQADSDGNGVGDACDVPPPADGDGDGVPDDTDNCPTTPNADQADTDGNGVGDACDVPPPADGDGDGVPDDIDNCPATPNAEQADLDTDGVGDVCDGDDDGDGVPDDTDNCPRVANADQSDGDSDGLGDACDADSAGPVVLRGAFDEGSGPSTDLGSGLVGTLEGGSTWTEGQQGKAILCDGTGYVKATDGGASAADFGHALTLAVWVRPDALGGTQMVISKDNAYELELGKVADGLWNLRLANAVQGNAETPLAEGVWQHLAVTWDGATVRYYRNGQPDGSDPFGGVLPSNDSDLGLGARPTPAISGGPAFFLVGALDEARLYDRALGATEIGSLFAASVRDITPPVRSNRLPGAPLAPAALGTAVDFGLDTGEAADCRYAFGNGGIRFADMPAVFGTADALNHRDTLVPSQAVTRIQARCRDALGNTNADDYLVPVVVAEVDLVSDLAGFWTFDSGSGCAALDASAVTDGALGPDCVGGNAPQWIDGVMATGLDFDGDDDRVSVPSTAALGQTDALTMAAWIRHAPTVQFRAIVEKRDAGNDGYNLFLTDQSKLFARVNGTTLASPDPVADGAWHHVAGVWDGASLTLYVDGASVATTAGGGGTLETSANLLLGHHFSQPGYSFAGQLDEVTLHRRALEAPEVFQLFVETQP